jgi:hypothetical protein
MNSNCYSITWSEDEESDECSLCFTDGCTIAEVDEKFARMHPESYVIAVHLLGEFLIEEGGENTLAEE